ncbi:argininosuccinate synthase [miscellaneous Crenarchaeota group-1 archaeon SG8-32-3]|uniref:Argininosuccinate synthase n=1 Tax=miscellaneous Crenarchaeota group-1 archaeon SG8-32-3 TaxID=1685125 RepID=A0A0M0BRE6_9ARCH|nr:MAG: argininosuccinate synthase [miscellaneous Crenarchaeota group-1 archaeon SG8-32-3]
MIKWLQEKYNAEVITATVNVGQPEDLAEVEEKANNLGVLKHYSIDAKEEFATDYIFPAIKANALYEGKYPISTTLSRPLIVAKMAEIAEKEGATALAHGCTGKGNDQVRFDISIGALAPDLKIIAPVREWNMTRDEEIEYAKVHGIPVSTASKKYSIDQSIWGRSIECGVLEDASKEPPEDAFEWTTAPEKAPNTPEYVTIEFEAGVPVALNNEALAPLSLIEKLNKTAGKHGVGRIDHIEDRMVGIKSREIYECPAATVVIDAHKDLEKMVMTRHEVLFKQQIDAQWTFLAYAGLWLDPLREDLEAFINKSQENVNGKVRVKLYKGGLHIVGRSSPMSLYDQNLVNYNIKTSFNQAYSEGFIQLWGLQTRMHNILKRKAKEQKTKSGA